MHRVSLFTAVFNTTAFSIVHKTERRLYHAVTVCVCMNTFKKYIFSNSFSFQPLG